MCVCVGGCLCGCECVQHVKKLLAPNTDCNSQTSATDIPFPLQFAISQNEEPERKMPALCVTIPPTISIQRPVFLYHYSTDVYTKACVPVEWGTISIQRVVFHGY